MNITRDNSSLIVSNKLQNGEIFITKKEVEKEMINYLGFLKGKKVYIPNTKTTFVIAQHDAFVSYFATRSMMNKFCIKELSYSYYNEFNQFVLITITENEIRKEVIDNYDDSNLFLVCKQIDNVDVVICNPEGNNANDLFKYIYLSRKEFILSINKNFFSTKISHRALKENRIKFGYNSPEMFFDVNHNEVQKRGDMMWITSFDNGYIPSLLKTFYDINSYDYPKYDNFNAIDVKCIKMIPMGYTGVFGVPVTVLPRLNMSQFEIIGLDRYVEDNTNGKRFTINGKELFARILIRFRNN